MQVKEFLDFTQFSSPLTYLLNMVDFGMIKDNGRKREMNRITDKFISIPPYLSVSWKEVASIKANNNDLIITLKNGEMSRIPNLTPEEKDLIFKCHMKFLEEEPQYVERMPENMPIGFKIGTPDGIVQAFEHNPELSDSPPIPNEILEKIIESTQNIPMINVDALPQGEPGCNCFFCQIMNSLHGIKNELQIDEEEEVKDDELSFRDWDIKMIGEKLYTVSNPLDETEKYTVFLGEPIGCTCGQSNCEHIVSVLKS